MKVSIILTDNAGNRYEGEVQLTTGNGRPPAGKKKETRPKPQATANVNFSLPIRAFVKKHGRGLGGAQRFTLLVAYMSKGQPQKQVSFSEIENQWNKMKPLLGGKLNRAHSTRAKEYGWIDSPSRGVYVLLSGWKGILNA